MSVVVLAGCSAGPITETPCGCDAIGGVDAGEPLRLPGYRGDPTVMPLDSERGVGSVELVEATDIERLSDGRIVIANTGRHEVVFFDARGRVARVVGSNPEDAWKPVGAIFLAVLPGDSVLANDMRGDRIQVLSSAGELIRSFTLPFRFTGDPRAHIQLLGVLNDGSAIWTQTRVIGSERPDGIVRDSTEFAVCRLGFEDCESLGWFLADERMLVRGEDRLPRLGSVPNGVKRETAIVGGRLVVTYGDGTPLLITDVQRGVRDESPIILPPTVRILGDLRGKLWVRSDCSKSGSRTWWVIDLDARQCGTVELPARFTPHVIERGYAVGVWEHPIGEEDVAELVWERTDSRGPAPVPGTGEH